MLLSENVNKITKVWKNMIKRQSKFVKNALIINKYGIEDCISL
jgi:hypothetical protein